MTDQPGSADTPDIWRSASGEPLVSAIVCTRDRPQLLARAVAAIVAQDYAGPIEIVLVFDQSTPLPLEIGELPANRSIVTLTNARTPGLAGGRNTGILAATGILVAFCDDDDVWRPTKLRRQVDLLRQRPDAALAATGITIITEDGEFPRVGPSWVDHDDFIRSRVTEIHPSTFVMARRDIIGWGLVDESVPYSYGEDYELLLRITRHGGVANVTEALTDIHWNRPSFFAARWEGIAGGLEYLLRKYPEFRKDRVGRARVRGQIAFAQAALGRRRQAIPLALRTIVDDPRQLRGYAALAVSTGAVSAERLVSKVQDRGRGL